MQISMPHINSKYYTINAIFILLFHGLIAILMTAIDQFYYLQVLIQNKLIGNKQSSFVKNNFQYTRENLLLGQLLLRKVLIIKDF